MSRPIEDYSVIGDRHTAALIGRDGSVDWLCLPRFDSGACFAALLGTPEHGRWLLGPDQDATTTRRYLDGTTILETTHTTDEGVVVVTDLMPTGDRRADLVRRVTGVRGTVRMRHEWIVRTDYGRVRPWISRHGSGDDEVLVAIAGPDALVLAGDRLPEDVDHHHADVFEVNSGETLTFSLTWLPSWEKDRSSADFDEALERTRRDDTAWLGDRLADVPQANLVRRSILTLRLLTHEQSGGIVAAPTTSLPEDFGGERNWDYRYCWLRDAALTIEAMVTAGFQEEAGFWRDWLIRAVAGDPERMQIMYAVDGGRNLPERELEHLPGYADSRPVRIGNAAVDQRQTDVLGEVMVALDVAREAGLKDNQDSWDLQRVLVERLAEEWHKPDHGLWEIRGPERHFTHSRVMVWAAFDRAVRGVEVHGFEGDATRWKALRDQVRDEILSHGVDRERGCFTQHYDTLEVDAALLNIPLVGFLPGDDPLVTGTIRAVEEDLMQDGLLLRYRTSSVVDGLAGDEYPFLACSFWLVSAYAAAGRVEDATELFDRLCALANDIGLLSEEYDVQGARMAGNFPQAFSHLTLVQAALALHRVG